MKKIKLYILFFATLFFAISCDPIEDESLRKDYFSNVGKPISKEELEKAISVTQPIPNSDDKIDGDQIVVIKNNRPEIAGVWHIQTNIGFDKTTSDNDTIIYTSNGTYSIYFEALSAHKIVRTDPIIVQVTNCFDSWETILTGAKNKTDKQATKTWEFWPGPTNIVHYNGMYGNWKHDISVEQMHKGHNNWDGGGNTIDKTGNYTMVFAFEDNKLTTYNPDGTILKEGKYSFLHTAPEIGLQGQLITTVPLIGSETSWAGLNETSNVFWILAIDEKTMVVVHPQPTWNNGGEDWDYSAWYGFYRVKE